METTYSKSILIGTIAVVALGVAVFTWRLAREEPVPPETSAPAQVLSEEDKRQVLSDLAASSNASAQIPMKQREQILQKTHSPASSQSGTSSPYSQRQMEILRSLRYSEQ